MNLRSMLERDEGRRNVAYLDTRGNVTIGVGHTGPEVHKGLVWTEAQIDAALDADIIKATSGCRGAFPWFDKLNDARQAVLAAMAFQMGAAGLLKFHDTLHAIESQRFAHAAECMRQSNWAHQTPKRAIRMAYQMESGAWQS